ncbi:branched-chain amino acid ABC transporter permease [Verminephrobacter aporrectodeae]|uniref:Branched-chain amino acid ABC transporter permease n=1 Tax=Verminephrobacter aporrectodeae subsp. tuberculatae TaxID=1110392 RepID=A0ABT3KWK0_9BURK|nr:branched-chain amino acid ABC transporter permease [Verminephrobacter aporrectodeae]MCW5221828.1 branched-chain amino acid ABC transporter permease [Verminephrobacter aporrectodeae subsp. tuberculatae]MCW5258138.1 branched-chain amino acid ABC transporter permease [Verminephrobacter aporrectodeae subsp. tuberculatae]MCW5291119.1 branched-chain amino acid ABC transporter permease [Verminephrobacter aporrectodeae subsp. tuberculatae]MCW5322719.1 branched-chain amino acid ABC transporter permea
MGALFQGRCGWALLALGALVFPLLAQSSYLISVATQACIMGIAALGLNLITGYTGQLNLAHGAFMAVGAYTVGILTVDHQLPFWIAFVLAGGVTALLGFFIGVLSLRLRGHYFSIFTLCVGYILFLLIEKWERLTHGPVGIMGIPVPPGIGPLQFATPLAQYYLALAFLALGIWVMARIVRSLLGRSFIAVRNGDALAEALGIDLMRTKTLSFVLSVLYAGFAGGLYAGQVRVLGPDLASESLTFDLVMFMLVGGIGTLLGPLVGTCLMTGLTQSLQFLQDYRMLVFGPLLVVLIIFLPDGIVGSWLRHRARRAASGGRSTASSPFATETPAPPHA